MIQVILDSGAFSAWTRKKSIGIDAYIEFIHKHKNLVDFYVNLDVIPGEFGRTPSQLEVKESADAGLKNLEYFETKGLRPMPVFHQGEDFSYIDRYVEKGYDYIGISPANDRGTPEKTTWLDQVFKYIADENGYPKIKTHGFAVTALDLMFRYPWFSVDSASWAFTGAFGSILIPKQQNGKVIWNEVPWRVSLSTRAQTLVDKGVHITTFSPTELQYIENFIESMGFCLGKSEFIDVEPRYKLQENERWALKSHKRIERIFKQGLMNNHNIRDRWNIKYFVELEKNFPPWPWPFKPNKTKGFDLL